MTKIQEILIDWYQKNKRDLPWRHSESAYHIWLSEIIMQQTQVIQGTKYFINFITTYPTIVDLANAPEDNILALWQGLGYYNRAKNLHFTAQYIRDHHNGIFPSDYKEILQLKGVGIYTAAAISTFAFNNPYPLVDGNVFRLYSRLFNVDTEINTTTGQKEFIEIAKQLLQELNKSSAVIYNQAIMEFGALVCKPKQPQCTLCPLQVHCISFSNKNQLTLPKKKKAKSKTQRTLHYFYLYNEDGTWIQKRTQKDIWEGLFQLPLLEVKPLQEPNLNSISVLDIEEMEYNVSIVKHQLSHQTLTIHFHKQYVSKNAVISDYRYTEYNTVKSIGFPQPIFNFLKQEIN